MKCCGRYFLRGTTMDQTAVTTEALRLARHLRNSDKHGQALAYFLIAFHSDKELKDNTVVVDEFVDVFCVGCDALLQKNDTENLTRCSDVDYTACYGKCMFTYLFIHVRCRNLCLFARLGYYTKSMDSFTQALHYNPHCASTIENVDNLKCRVVDRWHFRMLNDQLRNKAFYKAIRHASTLGFTNVLDIGCGSSLLSMMALRSKFASVSACDENPIMLNISKEVISANYLHGEVNLIAKNSTDVLTHGSSKDLNEKVDVIVTETVDCGLFGERILSTLSHAWKNLLCREKPCLVIPGRAELYCTLIECEEIRKHHVYHSRRLGSVDLSGYKFVDVTANPREVLPNPEDYDPYTTYDLRKVRGGYRSLTHAVKCLKVNFNSEEDVDHLLSGHREVMELEVELSGKADAVAVWFDLYVDENNMISSNPEVDNTSCWDVAVFPISDAYFFNANSRVSLEMISVDDHLEFNLLSTGNALSHCTVGADNSYWLDVRNHYTQEVYSKLCQQNNVKTASVLSDRDGCAGLELHCVFCDPINSDGTLKSTLLRDLAYISSFSVKGCRGRVLPQKLRLHGICINSTELMESSRVLGTRNTCGFDVQSMNNFQTRTHRDIDLHALDYTLITQSTKLLVLDLNSEETDERGYPSYLNASNTVKESCLQDKSSGFIDLHAIVYWFEFEMKGSSKVSTLDQRTHYRQAAVVLPQSKTCSFNDQVEITAKIVDGALFIDASVGAQL
ncbi:PRMT9 [Bugula neritina]|uniref:PRMT9 n=1 Tax=Bugula neritina TaxID=10212 RepID=A0A7J7JLW1_BUGNE|nr:PRMT9 [Bugula neritina]